MIPRIVIPVPTSFDAAYNRLNFSAYADAVKASGGTPVECPLDRGRVELSRMAESCDGILLPGSPADVDPAKYGQEREEATAPADTKREAVDEFLIEHALSEGKPILGICFGMQMLNVFCGGTLIQDLTVLPVNHSAGRAVMVAHTAAVDHDSILAGMIDASEKTEGFLRLPVNSSHHQAVGIPGRGLKVTARCPQDGVVEAIEGSAGSLVLGVQWHPERTFDSSASSRALFARLVQLARTLRPVSVVSLG